MNGDDDQEKIEMAAAAVFSADDMERTEDYLKRGQPFQHFTIEELGQRWTNGIKAWCRDYSKEWLREFDDAAAELRLRGSDPPFETVRDEIAARHWRRCWYSAQVHRRASMTPGGLPGGATGRAPYKRRERCP